MAKAKKQSMMQSNKILLVIVILIGLIAALYLTVSGQVFKRSGAWDCDRYNITVARDGVVTVVNASIYAEAATGVEVYINDVLADTLQAPALAQGQQATIGAVPVPANGAFTWRAVAVADRRCDDRGSYTATPSPTPTTPPTTPPTTSPTIRPSTPASPTPTPIACRLEMNFERFSNGSVPTDNVKMVRQYAGVTFSMKNPASNIKVPTNGCSSNIGPLIAKRGSPRTAFQGYKGVDDTSEPYNRTGDFILTDDGKLSPTATYDYACTIRMQIDDPQLYSKSISLDILDIDKEGYVVRGYNQKGMLIDTTTVPPTIPGNGIAYKVSVVSPTEDKIAAVEVVPNSFTKADGWGWGIDNICLK